MPGVPDVYQGTELWDNSLVDPDNRRPVDFAVRPRPAGPARRAAGGRRSTPSGAAKLLVVSRALRLRRDRPELFTGYRPVRADGPARGHVVAFDRGGVIAVATRLPVRSGRWSAAGATPSVPAAYGDSAEVYPTRSPAGLQWQSGAGGRSPRPLPRRAVGQRLTPTGGCRDRVLRVGAGRRPGTPADRSGRRRPRDARTAAAAGGASTSRRPARAPTTPSCSTTTTRPLPDPRSAWQPDGVHGPSRLLRPRRRSPGPTGLDRPAAARQRPLRAARRHVHPGAAPSTPPSSGSTTSSTSASTSSSCCRSTPSTASTTGATTASAGSRRTSRTAAPTG